MISVVPLRLFWALFFFKIQYFFIIPLTDGVVLRLRQVGAPHLPAVHAQDDGGGEALPLAVHRVQVLHAVWHCRERCGFFFVLRTMWGFFFLWLCWEWCGVFFFFLALLRTMWVFFFLALLRTIWGFFFFVGIAEDDVSFFSGSAENDVRFWQYT